MRTANPRLQWLRDIARAIINPATEVKRLTAGDTVMSLRAARVHGIMRGGYALMMLASAPIFAASFLMIKGQTRYETAWVIVAWQAITVSVWSFPLALISWRAPSLMQYVAFLSCGILGAVGQYMLARGFALIDISAAQSVRFLDLVWAALLGWLIFADVPSHSTVLGGAVICASTFWIARREARSLSRT